MDKQTKQLYCNCCGKLIGSMDSMNKNQVIESDWLEITKSWGYFSDKDGKKHHFCICESCYDKWLENFAISVEESEETELLSPEKYGIM